MCCNTIVNICKVIGDKKGGRTSKSLAQNLSVLEEIKQVVEAPMKFMHVIRNPFDIRATELLVKIKIYGNKASC